PPSAVVGSAVGIDQYVDGHDLAARDREDHDGQHPLGRERPPAHRGSPVLWRTPARRGRGCEPPSPVNSCCPEIGQAIAKLPVIPVPGGLRFEPAASEEVAGSPGELASDYHPARRVTSPAGIPPRSTEWPILSVSTCGRGTGVC